MLTVISKVQSRKEELEHAWLCEFIQNLANFAEIRSPALSSSLSHILMQDFNDSIYIQALIDGDGVYIYIHS